MGEGRRRSKPGVGRQRVGTKMQTDGHMVPLRSIAERQRHSCSSSPIVSATTRPPLSSRGRCHLHDNYCHARLYAIPVSGVYTRTRAHSHSTQTNELAPTLTARQTARFPEPSVDLCSCSGLQKFLNAHLSTFFFLVCFGYNAIGVLCPYRLLLTLCNL